MDNAPFRRRPAEWSILFSSSLYKSNEYFLILVIVADGPIWLTNPAACHVVPEVNLSLSNKITSFQPNFAK